MDLSNSIISFIDGLGVVQGLLFGFLLILLHSKTNKPTLYLGCFIILFALEPIPNILHDLNILKENPRLELLPVGFHFLAFPLLLTYIEKTSILDKKKIHYWTLYPGYLEVFITMIVFLLPTERKLLIKNSYISDIYFFSGLFYSIYIIYLILKHIKNHVVEVENQYAYIHENTLSWTKKFAFACILFNVLIFINFFIDSHVWYTWISIFNVILLYWVSFKGITQENIVALTWKEKSKEQENLLSKNTLKNSNDKSSTEQSSLNLSPKNNSELMTSEAAKIIFQTIENYIKNSECFLNDKLTIVDIAEGIDIHPKRISFAINSIASLNFNSFVNSYRIEFAKKLLINKEKQNLSIEGIGLESGFHSKATFYNAFKKSENMTPAQYKTKTNIIK